ncbi:MAG: recombinase family protein [Porphyromonadaceae bacterium]|nr:MAG: recombinase family protein [Porphyromonadaceae bacterium]
MKYVSYLRVSTKKQGESGLGLEAQREIVTAYLANNHNELIGEFVEVESGKRDKRPKLAEAIELARANNASLILARLDRLSRNLSFITKLMESKVKFLACDIPQANDLTVHVLAAVAQDQQRYISERTREGLKAKRVREPLWKPGVSKKWAPGQTSNLTPEIVAAAHREVVNAATSNPHNRRAYHYARFLRDNGKTLDQIAVMLNREGYPTRRQTSVWCKVKVFNLLRLFERNPME